MKKRIISAMLCVMLAAGFAACNGDETAKSSSQTSADGISTLTQDSTLDSSKEEQSKAPQSDDLDSSEEESSNSFDDVFTSNEDSEPDYEIIDLVPGTNVGDSTFQDWFSQNSIDRAYNVGMATAASESKIYEITSTASGSWEGQVTNAYDQALDSCETDDEKSEVKENQANWAANMDSDIQTIRDKGAGIDGEKEIMLYYRERVATLLNIAHENGADVEIP